MGSIDSHSIFLSISHWASSRSRADLKVFFEHLLQHVLVERQVGHQLFELRVFLLQLPQPAQLGRAQPAKLLLPVIKGRLADAHLPADFGDRGSGLGLLEGEDHLGLGILGSFHGTISLRLSY